MLRTPWFILIRLLKYLTRSIPIYIRRNSLTYFQSPEQVYVCSTAKGFTKLNLKQAAAVDQMMLCDDVLNQLMECDVTQYPVAWDMMLGNPDVLSLNDQLSDVHHGTQVACVNSVVGSKANGDDLALGEVEQTVPFTET